MRSDKRGLFERITRRLTKRSKSPFDSSASYWESRYRSGGNSGVGSYDVFAEFKAQFLNDFFDQESIESVIEFGCGDGNQLALLQVPDYVGVDVSDTALELCRARFADDAGKRFMSSDTPGKPRAEVAMSLDVIFHLVEDAVYEPYLDELFATATRFVIIYSSNDPDISDSAPHVRHRRFTDRVDTVHTQWTLRKQVPNRYPYRGDYRTGSFADFYVYAKSAPAGTTAS